MSENWQKMQKIWNILMHTFVIITNQIFYDNDDKYMHRNIPEFLVFFI